MIKRQLISILVCFSLIFSPFRPAHAFVPAAYLAGYIITSSGSAYRIGQAGLAIGAIAMLLLSGDSTTKGTKGRIGLSEGLEPASRQQKVEGTTTYGPPQGTDVNIPCKYTIYGKYVSNGSAYTLASNETFTCGEAWTVAKSWVDSTETPTIKDKYTIIRTIPPAGQTGYSFRYGFNQSGTDSSVNYGTLDGGYSYVQAPRTTSDKLADVGINKDIETGNITFKPYKDDPDFLSTIDGTTTHPAVSSDGKTATMYGVDGGGNNRSLQTVFNGDGTVGIIEVTNNPDGSTVTIGQTNLDVTTGSIVSATTQTKTARVDLPQTQTINTTPEPTTQTGTGTTPVTVTVQFPSDYARQYEAETAAQTVVSKLDQIRNDFNQTSTSPSTPEIPDFEFFGDTFDGLLSFTLPAHTSQCPTGSFDWNGTHTFDAHCGLINDHKTELDVAMVLMWSLLAIGLVLRS